MTDNKEQFDVYEDILSEYDANEERMKAEYLASVLDVLKERNYNRDYSYLSVYTYALQGRTLEQVSDDDLSLLHNLLSRNVDDFDETTHQPRFFKTLMANIKRMRDKIPQIRNNNDYLTLYNYAREHIRHREPFQPIIAPPVPSPPKERAEPQISTLGESIEEVKQKLKPIKPKDKRKRRNSYSGGKAKSFNDLLQE